jgi:sulfur carrier protein ThiS adenylyltransferase
MLPFEDRFRRQQELVPRERLRELEISVIGVGAIGRQVALQLAAVGASRLVLVDFDIVDSTNVTTQGYLQSDVGALKVLATARMINAIDPAVSVQTVAERWRPALGLGEAAFCCVDSITARSAIWRSAGRACQFWADGRMRADVLRVMAAWHEPSRRHYPTTLFPQAEAQTGNCTSRSTLYAASIAAGVMVHQLARWLRGAPPDSDVTINLLAAELSVAPIRGAPV